MGVVWSPDVSIIKAWLAASADFDERSGKYMKKEPKIKEIVVKLDDNCYERINRCADTEHIELESFAGHIILHYINNCTKDEKEGGVLL